METNGFKFQNFLEGGNLIYIKELTIQ